MPEFGRFFGRRRSSESPSEADAERIRDAEPERRSTPAPTDPDTLRKEASELFVRKPRGAEPPVMPVRSEEEVKALERKAGQESSQLWQAMTKARSEVLALIDRVVAGSQKEGGAGLALTEQEKTTIRRIADTVGEIARIEFREQERANPANALIEALDRLRREGGETDPRLPSEVSNALLELIGSIDSILNIVSELRERAAVQGGAMLSEEEIVVQIRRRTQNQNLTTLRIGGEAASKLLAILGVRPGGISFTDIRDLIRALPTQRTEEEPYFNEQNRYILGLRSDRKDLEGLRINIISRGTGYEFNFLGNDMFLKRVIATAEGLRRDA